jgi:hypothetical protein
MPDHGVRETKPGLVNGGMEELEDAYITCDYWHGSHVGGGIVRSGEPLSTVEAPSSVKEHGETPGFVADITFSISETRHSVRSQTFGGYALCPRDGAETGESCAVRHWRQKIPMSC